MAWQARTHRARQPKMCGWEPKRSAAKNKILFDGRGLMFTEEYLYLIYFNGTSIAV